MMPAPFRALLPCAAWGPPRCVRPVRLLRQFFGAALAAVLVACGGGGDGVPNTPEPPPPASTGTVSGLAVSAVTGAPMAGVTVQAGTRTATTGADGRYTLASVPPGAVVLAFTAADHTRAFANATVVVGQTSQAQARLSPVGTRQTYSAAAGATIALAGSPAQVALPAGGIVTAAGAAYAGTVTVELSPINPALDPGNMPGDMTTRLPDNSVAPIESFGAMAVVLTDAAGNRLNLASGQQATLRIPLSTRSASPPATVPLFWFNETTGLWVQEGTATLAGTAPDQYYEGTVTHFTVWNADQVINTVQVSGCLRTAEGAAVAGAGVQSEGLDYSGRGYAVTDASGNFSVAMRRGSRAVVSAQTGALYSNSVEVGPSEATITLPNCLQLGNGTPVFVRQPVAQSATEGSFVVLQALARGQAPLRYQWQRNGVDIPGATATAWVVDPIGNADNGASYRVVARNEVGSALSDAAVITVASLPPAIGTQPVPQSVVAGQSASFTVQMLPQGQPLAYQWLRNGQAIANATAATLTLASTTLADSGALFSVRVTNSAGTVTSDTAALTVTPAPVAPAITQQPLAASVYVGQSASFSVGATGSEPLAYRWLRNGQTITGAIGSSYAIAATTLADNGARFQVVVSNGVGTQTSAEVTLTVTEPPAGSGYYLVAHTGMTASGAMVYANGAQTARSPALVAVNAGRPGDGVVTIEPAGQAVPVMAGAFETTLQGNQLSNTRMRYTFYLKGTRLYRLDHVAPNGAPQGQVVSTLLSTDICAENGQPMVMQGLDGIMDLANPGRSYALFQAPGTDGQCFTADDETRAVRADMGATDAAITFSGTPLLEILGSNGALQGLIVKQGLALRRLDANLANPQTLHTLSSDNGLLDDFSFGPGAPTVWLFVDGDKLYGYRLDGTAGAPKVLATLSVAEQGQRIWQMASRAGTAYVALSNGTSSRVLRIAEDLNVAPTTLTSAAPEFIYEMIATPTRLVITSMAGVQAMPLGGGALTTLFAPVMPEQLGMVFAAGETLYVSTLAYGDGTGMAQTVRALQSDGTVAQTWPNTSIFGSLLAPTVSLSEAMNDDTYALLMATNTGNVGDYAGATLRAVLGSTRATLVTYGTLPAAPSPLMLVPSGLSPMHYGQPGLLTLMNYNNEMETSDLVFFDSDAEGLLRLTDNIRPPAAGQLRPLAVRPTPRWLAVREGLRVQAATAVVPSARGSQR